MALPEKHGWLNLRAAFEDDLDEVATMIDDFVKGHPAEHHPRPLAKLRAALLGDSPVAHLIVATRRNRVVGMAQWFLIYDVFWAMRGVHAEWLYVRPEVRGLGIAAALIAEICAQGRRAGAEYLHGSGDDKVARLYERIAIGHANRECHLSAEAFQVFADLAGAPLRELVQRLPTPDLNRVPALPRTL
jgi:GNAT superfamily N-acetyltransferase